MKTLFYRSQRYSGRVKSILFLSLVPVVLLLATVGMAQAPTVASLQATGTNIKWYLTPTGGSPLSTSTPLVDGTHYYASQTVTGVESLTRKEVVANVFTTAAPSESTHSAAMTQVTWNWSTAASASGYKWNTSNNYATATDMLTATTKTETGLTCETAYTRYVWAYNTSTGCHSAATTLSSTTTTCVTLPTVTTTTASSIQPTTASGGGNVTSTGGGSTTHGVCWGTSPNPTVDDSHTTPTGYGTGVFFSSITGLTPVTLYYYRAYATNAAGTSYGTEYTFTSAWTCLYPITVNHSTSDGVAPVNKTVTYQTDTIYDGQWGDHMCFITKNLGATSQASSKNDATEASAGWYWQFNRKQGYQHDGTTRTPNTTWNSSIDELLNWEPANDPCTIELGTGWYVVYSSYWSRIDGAHAWTTWDGPYADLYMNAAGQLNAGDGSLSGRGTAGYYWSQDRSGSAYGWYFYMDSSSSQVNFSSPGSNKAYGRTVRCMRML